MLADSIGNICSKGERFCLYEPVQLVNRLNIVYQQFLAIYVRQWLSDLLYLVQTQAGFYVPAN